MLIAQLPYPDCNWGFELQNKNTVVVPGLGGAGEPDDLSRTCLGSEGDSYWFRFKCTSSGSFEFMVEPNRFTANFDFLLADACPCSPGFLPIVCNNAPPTNPPKFYFTGLSYDPVATFGVQYDFEILSGVTINLTAGKNYYLLINNTTGNGDGFTIRFAGTAGIGPFMSPGNTPINMTGITKMCENEGDQYFTVTAPSNFGTNLTYEWDVTPTTAEFVGFFFPNVTNRFNYATVRFYVPNTYTVKCTITDQCTGATATATKKVEVLPVLIDKDTTYKVCYEDPGYIYNNIFYPQGTTEIDRVTPKGCYKLFLNINPLEQIIKNLGIIPLCRSEVFSKCNRKFTVMDEGVHDDVSCPGTGTIPPRSCDTFFYFKIVPVLIDPVVNTLDTTLKCPGDSILLSACSTTYLPKDSTSIGYQWRRNGVLLKNQTNCSIYAKQPGTYTVEIAVTYRYEDTISRLQTKTCTEIVKIIVNPSTALPPPKPSPNAPPIICSNSSYSFNVSNPLYKGYYVWKYNNDTLKGQNGSSALIPVGFSNGKVCVNVRDSCLLWSSDSCINISIKTSPQKAILIGDTLVCNQDTTSYCIFSPKNGETYSWTTPNGTIYSNLPNSCIKTNWGTALGVMPICIKTTNECGAVDTCFNVNIRKIPNQPDIIFGNDKACKGDTQTYSIQSIADANSYSWSVVGGKIVSSNSKDTVKVVWQNTGLQSVCVHAKNECGASGNLCLGVNINDIPALLPINGVDKICQNESSTYSVSAINPNHLIEWSVKNGTILTDKYKSSVEVLWDKGTSSNQVCYTLTNECGLDSICKDIQVIPLPSAKAGINQKVCGFNTSLNAVSSLGAGVWSITQVPTGGNIAFSNTSSPTSGITASQCGTYTLQWTENNQGCKDSATTQVQFVENPSALSIIEVCNNAQTQYNVLFDIKGCSNSYSIKDLAGNTLSTINISPYSFSSALINESTTYNFIIEDNNGCKSDTISGSKKCNCVTKAGTMSGTLLEACENGFVQAVHITSSETLEADDNFEYILHDNSSIKLGNILARNTTGTFSKTAAINFNTIYYISYVAGNKSGSQVNLNDPCVSVSPGQPVIFYQNPKPYAGKDTSVCGKSIVLYAQPDLGNGFWSKGNLNNGVLSDSIFSNTSFTVTASGTYLLIWTDNNKGCIGKDSVLVTFRPDDLKSSTPTYICDQTGQFFTASISISGGTAPYTVNGVPIVGTNFLSSNFKTSIQDSLVVTDNFGCNKIVVPVFKICDCKTKAISVNVTNTILCNNDTLELNGQFTKDPNDIVEYLLSDNCDLTNPTIKIFDRNASGRFTLQAGMSCGTNYYVHLLVGNADANGNVDANDPCFQEKCNSVIFDCIPTVDAGLPTSGCGTITNLTGTTSVGNITWSQVNGPGTITWASPNASSTQLSVNKCGKYLTQLTANNKGCINTDTVSFTLNDPPQIANIKAICDSTAIYYNVFFDITACSPVVNVSGMSGGNLTNLSFKSNNILGTTANYSFVVTDPLGCKDSISGEQICDCYTNSGTMDPTLVKICVDGKGNGTISSSSNGDYFLDANDVFEYILTDNVNGNTLGNILDRNQTGSFNYKPTYSFGTIYYIVFATGDSLANGQVNLGVNNKCLALVYRPVQFFECPEIQCPTDFTVDCILNTTLTASTNVGAGQWQLVNSPTGSVVNLSDPISSSTALTVDKLGTYSFRRIQKNDIYSDSCLVNVTFRNQPAPTFNVSSISYTSNCKDTTYTVSITLTGIPPFRLVNNSTGATIVGNKLTSTALKSQSDYQFWLRDNASCDSTFIQGSFKAPCKSNAGTPLKEVVLCSLTDSIVNLQDLLIGEDSFGIWIPSSPVNIAGGKVFTRYMNAGVYEFYYVIPDKTTIPVYEGDTSKVRIIIHQTPNADAGTDKVITCSLSRVLIGGNSTQGTDIRYQWTGASVASPNSSSTFTENAGQYRLSVKNIITGCESYDSVTVKAKNEKPIGVVTAQDVSCNAIGDGYVQLTILGGNEPYFYKYQNSNLRPMGDNTLRFTALAAGEYKFTIQDSSDCKWDTTIVINNPKSFGVDLGQDFSLNYGDSSILQAKLIDLNDTEIGKIYWKVNGIDTLFPLLEFKVHPLANSLYCIFVENKKGCKASDCIIVNVDTKYPVYYPNAFSPDGNNTNDVFVIYGNSDWVVQVEDFSVFDRWGNLLHYAKTFSPGDENYGWNGTFKGKKMTPGVYVFSAKVLFKDGKTQFIKGDVTLMGL